MLLRFFYGDIGTSLSHVQASVERLTQKKPHGSAQKKTVQQSSVGNDVRLQRGVLGKNCQNFILPTDAMWHHDPQMPEKAWKLCKMPSCYHFLQCGFGFCPAAAVRICACSLQGGNVRSCTWTVMISKWHVMQFVEDTLHNLLSSFRYCLSHTLYANLPAYEHCVGDNVGLQVILSLVTPTPPNCHQHLINLATKTARGFIAVWCCFHPMKVRAAKFLKELCCIVSLGLRKFLLVWSSRRMTEITSCIIMKNYQYHESLWIIVAYYRITTTIILTTTTK